MNYLGFISTILLELLAIVTLNTCESDSPDNVIATDYVRTDSVHINFDSPQFRVLDIGNSYTRNCTDYLRHIMGSLKLDCSDISLYSAIFGGGTFKNWVDVYNGDERKTEYYIQRVLGDLKCDSLKNYGVYKGPEGLRALLNDYEWDLIIIHQASRYATDYDSWKSHSEAGYLDELIDIIKKCQPGVPLGSYIIHSYGNESKYNTEKMSTVERLRHIASSAKRMQQDYGIDIIIPYGTAIELLRATSLNDSKDLLADGTHLSSGLAQYTAACCYYESVFAPRFRKSMTGNGYRPNGSLRVTNSNASIAQQIARQAYERPFLFIE